MTSTGSSVYASKQIGNALISGSFGTPPAFNASGGQATLTGNAAGFLAAVLMIAGMMEVVDDWLQPAAAVTKAPTGSISHTCSCYGWQPEAAPAPAGQQAASGF